jgi:hypothetical protein
MGAVSGVYSYVCLCESVYMCISILLFHVSVCVCKTCVHVCACGCVRMCAPVDAFSVISTHEGPHKSSSSQAEGSAFVQLPHLLSALLESCPVFLPAAIKANVVPSLVHILMRMRSQPDLGNPSHPYTDLEGPLDCLAQLMHYDRTHGQATPISAITAILPLALDLFPRGTTAANVYLMMLLKDALLLAPAVDRGRWGPGLLRAMVPLLTGSFRPLLGLCVLSLTAQRSCSCSSHL